MDSKDGLIEIDFNKQGTEVLKDYKHNLELFYSEVERTIEGYLRKKTISEIIDPPGVHSATQYFDSYKDSPFYVKTLQKHKAIDFLPEYHRFAALLVSERIVGRDYFNFIALIEDGEYLDCENILDIGANEQEFVFKNDIERIIHQVVDFLCVYLDAKLYIIIDKLKTFSLENITYIALMLSEEPSNKLIDAMSIILTEDRFHRSDALVKGLRDFYISKEIKACQENPEYDVLRIRFLKKILPDLSDTVLTHHRDILNKEFKLSLQFIERQRGERINNLELVFTVDDTTLSALHFKTKFKIHADHCNLLRELFLSRPKAKVIKAAPSSMISEINAAMFQQYLIQGLIKTHDKTPRINSDYGCLIKSKLSPPPQGYRLAKRKKSETC